VLAKFDFQENLFWSKFRNKIFIENIFKKTHRNLAVFDDLLSDGRVNGTIQGRTDRAMFVPNVFSQARQAWIDSFFSQNGYMGKF
jgi:hypothetical protein